MQCITKGVYWGEIHGLVKAETGSSDRWDTGWIPRFYAHKDRKDFQGKTKLFSKPWKNLSIDQGSS